MSQRLVEQRSGYGANGRDDTLPLPTLQISLLSENLVCRDAAPVCPIASLQYERQVAVRGSWQFRMAQSPGCRLLSLLEPSRVK